MYGEILTMDEFLKKIAAILEVDELKASDDLKSFEQWDSLSVLSIIAMIDADEGANLNAADFEQINTPADLWDLVQAKKKA